MTDPRIKPYIDALNAPSSWVNTTHLVLRRVQQEHGVDLVERLLAEHWAQENLKRKEKFAAGLRVRNRWSGTAGVVTGTEDGVNGGVRVRFDGRDYDVAMVPNDLELKGENHVHRRAVHQ